MEKTKTYLVNIDMKWSKTYSIKAKTEAEAKKKAWEKFKKNLHKTLFELLADKKI